MIRYPLPKAEDGNANVRWLARRAKEADKL